MSATTILRAIAKSYLGKAFGLMSLSQAVSALTSFGVMSAYTRMLPPQEYGKISIIWLFLSVLAILVDTRLNTALCIRYFKVSREDNVRNIYSVLAYYIVVFSPCCALIEANPGLFGQLLHITLTATEVHLICLICLFMLIGNCLNSLLLTSKQTRIYFLVMLLFNGTLAATSGSLLFLFGYGYLSYLYGYLAAYGAVGVATVSYFLKNYPPTPVRVISPQRLMDLAKIGLPLVPDGLLVIFLTWAGRYILNLYTTLAVVGVYSVAYMFSNIFNSFVLGPFGQAVTPILFEKFASSVEEYQSLLKTIFRYYWLVAMTVLIGYFVVLREIFLLFVGPKYHDAYNIVAIMIVAMMFSGVCGYLGTVIILKEKTQHVFMITLLSSMVNIALNLLLVPPGGMYGSAFAMLGSFLVQFLLTLMYSQRLMHVDYPYRFIVDYGVICLLFGCAVIGVSYLELPVAAGAALKCLLFACYCLTVAGKTGVAERVREFSRRVAPAPGPLGEERL
ncbi:oligosaccharide flippase family protein [Geomonas sp. RF6]|uniref:oligosaccharide flippase family protein n=1 Tax=Geomonas sp. RF6 TaxID=2897342 RepID=UPI001E3F5156|nr:oligosaccharide flippase family protein [Geomonas sp. RF6]UFS71308.1 oligosaccharide flippase family protein [Geomonas sp. RF6]